MPKTCNAFNWTVYVVVASFIAWGVWFKSIQMNLFDTNPVIRTVHSMKKTADTTTEKPAVRLAMKPTEQKPLDEVKDCVLTRYEGYGTMNAWYEESDMYSEKMRVLRIADDSRYMLPEKVREWADGTPIEWFLPEGVGSPLDKILLKASAAKPAEVKIVEFKVYCEGLPSATLEQP